VHLPSSYLLLPQHRLSAGLGELQRARGQQKYKYFATAPAHTQRASHGAYSSKG
jgi:hypothetical protein